MTKRTEKDLVQTTRQIEQMLAQIAKVGVPVLFQVRTSESGADVVIRPTVESSRTDAVRAGDLVLLLARVYRVRRAGGYVLEDGAQKKLEIELSPSMEESFLMASGAPLDAWVGVLLDNFKNSGE